MKKIYTSTKNFVRNNKTELVVGTIATLSGIVAIQHLGIKSLNAFLTEKGLFDEYYHVEEWS